MNFAQLLLTALGLSMDAFAAAVCKGLSLPRVKGRHMLIIGLLFGGFQGFMPLVGWLLGSQFQDYIVPVDHWVAFTLLSAIGAKMVYDALQPPGACEPNSEKLVFKELLLLAIATSIDALAVGITFAFLKVSITQAVGLIGGVTFLLSALGVWAGHKFGAKYKNKAELCGGVILLLTGFKILLEHLGLLHWKGT